MQSITGSNIWLKAVLVLAVLVGCAFRVYRLDHTSLCWDEGASLKWAAMGPAQMIRQSGVEDTNPPGYHLLLHYWAGVFGQGDFALRLLSAVAGTAAIVAIYAMGSRLFGPRAGVIAAVLLAISEMNVRYSRLARGYPISVLLAILSMYFLYRLLRDGPTLGRTVGYVICAALMPYVHNYGLFFIGAANVFYLTQWWAERDKLLVRPARWIAIQSVLGLLLVPYAMFIRSAVGLVKQGFWTIRPVPRDLAITLMTHAGGAVTAVILVALCVVASASLFSKSTDAGEGDLGLSHGNSRYDGPAKLTFLLVWLIVPVMLPFIASWIAMPIFMYRYTIGASPALLLLAALGLSELFKRRLVGAAVTIGLVAVMSYRAAGVIRYEVVDEEPWRQVASWVDVNAKDGDVVVVYGAMPVFGKEIFDHYSSGRHIDVRGISTPAALPVTLADAEHFASTVAAAQRLWLVVAHEKDPQRHFKGVLSEHFQRVTSVPRFNRLKVDVSLLDLPVSLAASASAGPQNFQSNASSTVSRRMPQCAMLQPRPVLPSINQ